MHLFTTNIFHRFASMGRMLQVMPCSIFEPEGLLRFVGIWTQTRNYYIFLADIEMKITIFFNGFCFALVQFQLSSLGPLASIMGTFWFILRLQNFKPTSNCTPHQYLILSLRTWSDLYVQGHAERFKQWISMGITLLIVAIILHFKDGELSWTYFCLIMIKIYTWMPQISNYI